MILHLMHVGRAGALLCAALSLAGSATAQSTSDSAHAPSASVASSTARRFTLDEALQVAQQQGFQARAATAARDVARWQDRAYNGRLLPQLGLTGTLPSYSRGFVSVIDTNGIARPLAVTQAQSSLGLTLSQQVPWTGGAFFIGSQLQRADYYGDLSTRTWTSTPLIIGFQQDLLRPNELAWRGKEQTLSTEIADHHYLEAREDVNLATVGAFFDLYAARVNVENETSNALVNDTLYTLNKGRFEVGKIGENDLLQSELALLRARTSVDAARMDYQRALAAFRLQLNLPPASDVEVQIPAEIPQLAADTVRAVAEALRNRSEMRQFDLADVQGHRALSEAKYGAGNGWGARVTAQAGYNQTAPVLDSAYRSLLSSQQFTVSVDVPLVQWGARHADIEAAKAQIDQSSYSSRAARDALVQDAHFSVLQLEQSRRQLELSIRSDSVAAKRFDVAKNRYVIGKIGIDNLYIAQNEKDQAVLAYVQALRAYWIAYYRLRRVTLFDFRAGDAIR